MTLGEFDIEVGDQSMDVIIPLDLQTEGGGEGQFLWLHRVDVHFLRKDEQSLTLLFYGLRYLMKFSVVFLLWINYVSEFSVRKFQQEYNMDSITDHLDLVECSWISTFRQLFQTPSFPNSKLSPVSLTTDIFT